MILSIFMLSFFFFPSCFAGFCVTLELNEVYEGFFFQIVLFCSPSLH
jgi:hypothetical protein